MEPLVVYEKKDHIVYITLNRPKALNALNVDLIHELNKAWITFNRDDEAWVAILSGKGRAFCAGADINDMVNNRSNSLSTLFLAMPGIGTEDIWKPLIAAVSGHCIGAGLMLTMLCDIRIAADNTLISYTEGKVGVTGGLGADLVRHIPYALAMELLITSEPMKAQRAYEIGYFNKITKPEDLMSEATKTAEAVIKNAPLVARAIKQLAHRNNISPRREGLAIVNQIISPMIDSEDYREGTRAALEKQKPSFQGR